MGVVDPLNPLKCSRSFYNQVILPVVNHYIDFAGKKVLHQMGIGNHEVSVQSFINVPLLHAILDLVVEFVNYLSLSTLEIGSDEHIWVLMELGNIIHVYSACCSGNSAQNLLESLVKVVPQFSLLLKGSIDDDLLNFGSLLIIDQTHIVCILTHHRQSLIWESKPISNGNTFQSCQPSLIVLCLLNNLHGNCRGIFSGVTFPKYYQMMVWLEPEFIEATVRGLIELFEGGIEIICHILHAGGIDIGECRVGVAQPSPHRLIDKKHIEVIHPRVFVLHNLVGRQVNRANKVRAQFHEISQLTR